MQKCVVAFANSDGGELIIGAKDKKEGSYKERWDGFSDIESMNGMLQAVFNITPSVAVIYDVLKISDFSGMMLRLIIEKSADVCSAADGSVYQRHGAQSLTLKDPDRIQQLAWKIQFGWRV